MDTVHAVGDKRALLIQAETEHVESWCSTSRAAELRFDDFMTPSHDTGVPEVRFCNCRSSSRGRSRRAALRVLADNELRSAHSKGHRRIVAWASCRSPIRISFSVSQPGTKQRTPYSRSNIVVEASAAQTPGQLRVGRFGSCFGLGRMQFTWELPRVLSAPGQLSRLPGNADEPEMR